MLGDASRGFLLEHVLTKLRYIHHHRAPSSGGEGNAMSDAHEEHAPQPTLPPLQIIGLSATLPNIETLCHCLDASFYRQWHACRTPK